MAQSLVDEPQDRLFKEMHEFCQRLLVVVLNAHKQLHYLVFGTHGVDPRTVSPTRSIRGEAGGKRGRPASKRGSALRGRFLANAPGRFAALSPLLAATGRPTTDESAGRAHRSERG